MIVPIGRQCGSMKTKCLIASLCFIVIWTIFGSKDPALHKIYSYGKFFSLERSEQTDSVEEEIISQQEDISFDDIIIFVRTTTQNSENRMPSLFESWLPDAFKRINSLFVLSDGDDPKVSERIPGKIVLDRGEGYATPAVLPNVRLKPVRQDLWCKTSKELTIFAETDKKWFCHFDDDMYLNIDNLLKLLRGYDSNGFWYIGRRSEVHPHSIPKAKYRNVKIWFHNMGAGVCFSRGLIDKMKHTIRNDGFAKMAPSIGLFDDLVLGFIINHELRINFTESYLFHSQWENMSLIRDLEKQITLGYKEKTDNYLDVDGFSKEDDPYRFRSLHCMIHPEEDMCRIIWKRKAVWNVSLTDVTHLLIIYLPFLAFTFIMFRRAVKTDQCHSLLGQDKSRISTTNDKIKI